MDWIGFDLKDWVIDRGRRRRRSRNRKLSICSAPTFSLSHLSSFFLIFLFSFFFFFFFLSRFLLPVYAPRLPFLPAATTAVLSRYLNFLFPSYKKGSVYAITKNPPRHSKSQKGKWKVKNNWLPHFAVHLPFSVYERMQNALMSILIKYLRHSRFAMKNQIL